MKKTITVHCVDPWFSFIKLGIKPVEGRKNSIKYHKFNIGDILEFVNDNNDKFLAEITEIREYKNIEDYLVDVSYQKAVPGCKSFEEALQIYHQWNSPDEIRELAEKYQYGFLGIFIKLI